MTIYLERGYNYKEHQWFQTVSNTLSKEFIGKVTIPSYEKDFELTFTHNSTAIGGNTLTLSKTKVVLEDGISISRKELREFYEVINHKKHMDMLKAYC